MDMPFHLVVGVPCLGGTGPAGLSTEWLGWQEPMLRLSTEWLGATFAVAGWGRWCAPQLLTGNKQTHLFKKREKLRASRQREVVSFTEVISWSY